MNSIPSMWPALVESYDQAERTCRIKIPGITDGAQELPIAQIMQQLGDRSERTEIEILAGDRVWISFLEGDPRFPIIVGYRARNVENMADWRKVHHANVEFSYDGTLQLVNERATVRLEAPGGVVTIDAAANINAHAGSNVAIDAGANASVTAGAALSMHAGSDATLTASGSITQQSGAAMLLQAGGGLTMSVTGALAQTATGGASLAASGSIDANAGTAMIMQAVTTVALQAGTTLAINAGTSITLSAGGSTITLSAAGITATGATINLN